MCDRHTINNKMAGRSRSGGSPVAWSTIFYLLLVFVAPLAFMNTARADDQVPMQEKAENYGTGTILLSSLTTPY